MECVIVSYGSAEDLRSFGEDLAPGTFSRVLVVDNASPDDSVAVARSYGFDVVARTTNDGFGAAANDGIRSTSGELVTLLNPDVHVRDASLMPALEQHFQDDRIGLAAPALILPRGTAQDSAREIPTPWQLLQRRRTGRDVGALRPEEAQEVPWVVGAFMMIRRRAFEQVGGFDPRYFLYFEDVDLCMRMRVGGWKVWYDPEQRAYHQHRGASRGGFARRPTRLHMRSAGRFYRRNPWAIVGADLASRSTDRTLEYRRRSGRASTEVRSYPMTTDDTPLRVALVVSFQNEAEHLPKLLTSLDAQTEPADQVILVDDGSTDDSSALAADFARRHPHTARVFSRERRPAVTDRLADAPELSAFVSGVEALSEPWDVVAKIDGDLALSNTLVADVRRWLREDPGLGITGSYLAVEEDGTRRREQHPAEHVRGPNKFYRRACYEQITPLPTQLGWDTFDDLRARAAGWRTMSFAATGGDTLHLRPTGSHDGRLRAYRRWGLCAWAYGAHPLVVVLGAMRRSTRAPYALAGFHYLWGWCRGWAQGYPRIESETRAFARAEDLRRIRSELQRAIGVRP